MPLGEASPQPFVDISSPVPRQRSTPFVERELREIRLLVAKEARINLRLVVTHLGDPNNPGESVLSPVLVVGAIKPRSTVGQQEKPRKEKETVPRNLSRVNGTWIDRKIDYASHDADLVWPAIREVEGAPGIVKSLIERLVKFVSHDRTSILRRGGIIISDMLLRRPKRVENMVIGSRQIDYCSQDACRASIGRTVVRTRKDRS